MGNHVLGSKINNLEVSMYKFVIESDLLFGKFMVISIDLPDELSIHFNQPSEFLFEQTFHILVDFNFLILIFSLLGYILIEIRCHSHIWFNPKTSVHCLISINFED